MLTWRSINPSWRVWVMDDSRIARRDFWSLRHLLCKLLVDGYTLEQIAQTVGQLMCKEPSLKAQDDINSWASKPTKVFYKVIVWAACYRLEGYLFPVTYTNQRQYNCWKVWLMRCQAVDKAKKHHIMTEKNLTMNYSACFLSKKKGATLFARKRSGSITAWMAKISILYAQGKLGQKISLADDAGIG